MNNSEFFHLRLRDAHTLSALTGKLKVSSALTSLTSDTLRAVGAAALPSVPQNPHTLLGSPSPGSISFSKFVLRYILPVSRLRELMSTSAPRRDAGISTCLLFTRAKRAAAELGRDRAAPSAHLPPLLRQSVPDAAASDALRRSARLVSDNEGLNFRVHQKKQTEKNLGLLKKKKGGGGGGAGGGFVRCRRRRRE